MLFSALGATSGQSIWHAAFILPDSRIPLLSVQQQSIVATMKWSSPNRSCSEPLYASRNLLPPPPFSPTMQVPRRTPRSLSSESLGGFDR